MTGEHAQRVRRPSRVGGNRRRRATFALRLPSPRTLLAAGLGLLRQNLATIATALAVGAAGAGAWLLYLWLLSSPRFAVATIDVEGGQRPVADALRARLADARGQNLFRLDLGALEREAAREPWVKRAAVRRELPDRLVVEVEEHRAAAVVALGPLYLADADGHIFARAHADRDDLSAWPIVTGLDRAATAKDPATAAARIETALAIAAAWSAGGRPAVGELHLDDHLGVVLYTRDPAIAVHLGDETGEALARRLGVFDSAWGALDAGERARATSIHLGRDASPARVTVAFAEPR